MTIELTKNQYKVLLTMIYCGEWVLNSHKLNDDKLANETDDLEQLIYSFAKKEGIENWIEFDKEMGKFFPTADMEDKMHIFIDKYNKRQKQ